MRLTVYTDYALRLLMYLALRPDELVTIQGVAEAYGISRNHLMKVAQDLGRHGFIETVRGRGGGLRLQRPAAEIGIGDVVRATEDDMRLVECFDPDRNTCRISSTCRLKGVLGVALDAYLAVLDRVSLDDLVRDDPLLRQILLEDVGPSPAEPAGRDDAAGSPPA